MNLDEVETPNLASYTDRKRFSKKTIFRLTKEDLQLLFLPTNTKKPINDGECRVSLNILAECGYNRGLCVLLNTDPETGIIGDE